MINSLNKLRHNLLLLLQQTSIYLNQFKNLIVLNQTQYYKYLKCVNHKTLNLLKQQRCEIQQEEQEDLEIITLTKSIKINLKTSYLIENSYKIKKVFCKMFFCQIQVVQKAEKGYKIKINKFIMNQKTERPYIVKEEEQSSEDNQQMNEWNDTLCLKQEKSELFGFDDEKIYGMPAIALNITPIDHFMEYQQSKIQQNRAVNYNTKINLKELQTFYLGLKMEQKVEQQDKYDYQLFQQAKHQEVQTKKQGINNIISKIKQDERQQFLEGKQGLKQLSKKVYQIMTEVEKTTYLQVAAELNRRVTCGESKQKTSKNEEHKDYKRRVYDALNVMVATEVLKKEGKYVSLKKVKMCKNSTEPLVTQEEEITKLAEQIRKKLEFIERQKEKLEGIKKKIEFLKSYKQRGIKSSYCFVKPVIGIFFKNEERIGQLQVKKEDEICNEVNLKFSVNPVLYGSFDILLRSRYLLKQLVCFQYQLIDQSVFHQFLIQKIIIFGKQSCIILIFQMGNSKQNAVQQSLKLDWKLIKKTHNTQIYEHCLSHDLCELSTLYNIQLKELDIYSSRKKYSFVHTPIIYSYHIIRDPKDSKFISSGYNLDIQVLVESIATKLSNFDEINNYIVEDNFLLRKFQEILLGFQYLYNKYGSFRISPAQIGWTSNKLIKVWINPNFSINVPETRSTSEGIMLEDIFTIFRLVVNKPAEITTFANALKDLQSIKSRCNVFESCIMDNPINQNKSSSNYYIPKPTSKPSCLYKDMSWQNEVGNHNSYNSYGTERWINTTVQGSFNESYSLINGSTSGSRFINRNLKSIPNLIKKSHLSQKNQIKQNTINFENIPKLNQNDHAKLNQNTSNKLHENSIQFNSNNHQKSIHTKVSFTKHTKDLEVRNTMQSYNISNHLTSTHYNSERRSTINTHSRHNLLQKLVDLNTLSPKTYYHNSCMNPNHTPPSLISSFHSSNLTKQMFKKQQKIQQNNINKQSMGYRINNIINDIPLEESFTHYDSEIRKYQTKSDSKLDKKCGLQKYQEILQQNQHKNQRISINVKQISQQKKDLQPQIIKSKFDPKEERKNGSNLSDKIQNDLQALFGNQTDQMTDKCSYSQLRDQLHEMLN